MKKFLVLLVTILTGLVMPAFANEDKVMPSETGVVEAIQNIYNDEEDNQQNTQQIVDVKVLSGEYKNQTKQVVNFLTDNPAYNISLKKGDKVILHLEEDETGGTNFFIADLKRDNSILFFGAIFCSILIAIGRKKGLFSLISIIATVVLILAVMVPLILNGFCPIISAIIIGVLSTVITIYLVGGFNAKSSSAILGYYVQLNFCRRSFNACNLHGSFNRFCRRGKCIFIRSPSGFKFHRNFICLNDNCGVRRFNGHFCFYRKYN